MVLIFDSKITVSMKSVGNLTEKTQSTSKNLLIFKWIVFWPLKKMRDDWNLAPLRALNGKNLYFCLRKTDIQPNYQLYC